MKTSSMKTNETSPEAQNAKNQSTLSLNAAETVHTMPSRAASQNPAKTHTASHLLYAVAVSAYLNNDNRALSLFLQNPQASLAEKALIRARKEMKVGRYDEATKTLESFSTDSDLLRGERYFLLASLHSHASRWELALKDAHQAALHYVLCHNERGLFLSHYNLSVYYNRIGLDEMSLHHIDEAAKYAKTPAHQSLLHRAKACDHSRRARYSDMINEIDLAMHLRDRLDETERATLDAVAADLYFRGGEREKAKRTLENLANSKVIRDKARARFDLILLTALMEKRPKLVDGEPTPAIKENFEYRARWKILSSLQSGDWSQAQTKWAELQKHFPLRYAADFKCLAETDERSIFMTALRTLMTPSTSTQVIEEQIVTNLTGKQLKFFEILSHAPIALRKEELIERIWETAYDPQLDARFYKLVERMRKDSGLQIEMINQTYRLKS